MMNCETCQPRLLHHLYGLLEGAEAGAVLAHLDGCPACQAALAKARGQQQVLAAAAKAHFPDVRFAPAPHSPATAPTLQVEAAARPRRFARWAVAASILVLLGSSAGFTAVVWQSYSAAAERARADLQRADAA